MLKVSCINYIKIFKSCEVINSVLKKKMLVFILLQPNPVSQGVTIE